MPETRPATDAATEAFQVPAALSAALPASLEAMVVKDHVHLGGLTHEARLQALALLWCALPASPLDERGVNEALKARLADVGAFLATDHVELRRWLVDMGFLARDGFGRVYERVAFGGLPSESRAAALPLKALADSAGAGADAMAVREACSAARERRQRERARRRAAWEAAAGGLASGAG